MKRLFALTLALLMALTCVSAFADTVYTKVTVDGEVVKGLMTAFGVGESDTAMVDPIIALVNALGVNVTTVADGAQIDLDLNGKEALTLGFAAGDAGYTVASTLFPNYLVTVSQETVNQFMEQMAANMPSVGSGDGSAFDMNAITETFGAYFQKWFDACASAGQPGDPVTGEYEFEGYTFDTMVPVTVDMAAINDATKTLMDELLADPAAMSMLKGFAQGYAQNSGETFDEANFEAEFKAGFEEWMAHFPATASAEFYTNSDSEGIPFYLLGTAQREGETDPFTCYMLMIDESNMSMGYQDGQTTSAGFVMNGNDMSMYFKMGEELYMGLALSIADDQFGMDVYFMNDEKPVISLAIAMAEGGERTLSLDAEGKTTLTVEELMSGEGDAAQGLLGDIMANGLGELMGTLTEQVPEVAGLMSMFTGGEAMAG